MKEVNRKKRMAGEEKKKSKEAVPGEARRKAVQFHEMGNHVGEFYEIRDRGELKCQEGLRLKCAAVRSTNVCLQRL